MKLSRTQPAKPTRKRPPSPTMLWVLRASLLAPRWCGVAGWGITRREKQRVRRALCALARLELLDMRVSNGIAEWRAPLDQSRATRAALWLAEHATEGTAKEGARRTLACNGGAWITGS